MKCFVLNRSIVVFKYINLINYQLNGNFGLVTILLVKTEGNSVG